MKYYLIKGNDTFGCVYQVFDTKEEAFDIIKQYPNEWWKLIEGKRIHFSVTVPKAIVKENE